MSWQPWFQVAIELDPFFAFVKSDGGRGEVARRVGTSLTHFILGGRQRKVDRDPKTIRTHVY